MTDPHEFAKFHNLLMESAPEDYIPYLFVVDKSDKAPHITLKETEELLSDDISQLNSKLKSLNTFIVKYRTVDRIVDRSVWEARVQRREIINRIFELEGVTK